MSWMKHYHEDHMSVLLLLDKLDGNLKALETDIAGPGLMFELKEFGEILEKIIIPHFKDEEKTIYVETSKISDRHRNFVFHMLDDHRQLYDAFTDYEKSLDPLDKEKLLASGKVIIKVLRSHIIEEEKVLPELAKERGLE